MTKNVDMGSLVISCLWQRGGQALLAEIAMATSKLPADVVTASVILRDMGWVDLLHEELPVVRLTPEARDALMRHQAVGTPLPERFERAAEREARLREAAAMSQVELVNLLRETREESREMRQMLLEQRGGAALPYAPAPRRIAAGARCVKCSTPPAPGARFCAHCGSPIA